MSKNHASEDANKEAYEKEVAEREKKRADEEVRLAVQER